MSSGLTTQPKLTTHLQHNFCYLLQPSKYPSAVKERKQFIIMLNTVGTANHCHYASCCMPHLMGLREESLSNVEPESLSFAVQRKKTCQSPWPHRNRRDRFQSFPATEATRKKIKVIIQIPDSPSFATCKANNINRRSSKSYRHAKLISNTHRKSNHGNQTTEIKPRKSNHGNQTTEIKPRKSNQTIQPTKAVAPSTRPFPIIPLPPYSHHLLFANPAPITTPLNSSSVLHLLTKN